MVAREWARGGVKEIGVVKRVQIFIHKLNKFEESKVKQGDYSADYKVINVLTRLEFFHNVYVVIWFWFQKIKYVVIWFKKINCGDLINILCLNIISFVNYTSTKLKKECLGIRYERLNLSPITLSPEHQEYS